MDRNKFDCFCDCFETAFHKIVSGVTEIEFTKSGAKQKPAAGKTLSAIVRVVGSHKGRIHVEIHAELARKLYEYSNGEPPQDEMDLCFYLAEFTNMVAGNGITTLNNIYKGDNLRLTPPAIFADENLEITIPKVLASSRTYYTKYGTVTIEIGFEGM